MRFAHIGHITAVVSAGTDRDRIRTTPSSNGVVITPSSKWQVKMDQMQIAGRANAWASGGINLY